MEYKDKTITCRDCGKEFTFTAGEQEFYAEKGFQNEPVRCKECRDAKRNSNKKPFNSFKSGNKFNNNNKY